MDQWKEKEERLMEVCVKSTQLTQIELMQRGTTPTFRRQVGGNSRCRQFLETHAGDYKKGMSIEDKWKTKAAHLWRDKVCINHFMNRLCCRSPVRLDRSAQLLKILT
jgi:hypothetical protein